MCLEDLVIDRQTKSGLKSINVTQSTAETLVSAAPARLLLVIGAPTTGTVWLNPGGAAAIGTGLSLAAGDPPFIFRQSQGFGDLTVREWSIFTNAAGVTLSVIEGINAKFAKQADASE